jgi:hypothetical protein
VFRRSLVEFPMLLTADGEFSFVDEEIVTYGHTRIVVFGPVNLTSSGYKRLVCEFSFACTRRATILTYSVVADILKEWSVRPAIDCDLTVDVDLLCPHNI